MQSDFIGRKKEVEILQDAFNSREAEMVAVIGRRRVGKTFLIKETYKAHITFELTGLQKATLKAQLAHFSFSLAQQSRGEAPSREPSNWLEAFQQLSLYLNNLPTDQRQVIFFDELPWMATPRSGFLTGLGFFWNSWAVNKNVVLVICGSAASWMIKKVINNTGGLYNRVTKRIFLQPFTLAETELYLKSRNINFNRYQITQLYMAMGGIPHYLKEVKAGKSAIQNIDEICFTEYGLLRTEFKRLFLSLFKQADKHIAIIKALAGSHQGLTRKQLIAKSNISEGGNSSSALEELMHSGFVQEYFSFNKKVKDKLYRLTDEYSLFYLTFLENKTIDREQTWQHLSQTQSFISWSGYAFESICLKHIQQIKKALSIAGIYSTASTFYHKKTADLTGAQIDLLLDRNDSVINLFEIKFYNNSLSLTQKQANAIREKMHVFQEITQTKKYLMPILITTFGLNHNQHSLGLIESIITLDDLFD